MRVRCNAGDLRTLELKKPTCNPRLKIDVNRIFTMHLLLEKKSLFNLNAIRTSLMENNFHIFNQEN